MSDQFSYAPLQTLKAPGRYSMVGGPFGSKLVGRDYVSEGVPVIRGTNLPSDSKFSFDDLVFVTEEKVAADLFGNLAFPGDIVVTQRGTLGQVGLIPSLSPYPKFVVSQSQMKLTVDRSKADPQFVYYALRSPVGQHEIRSGAITAGVPHINLSLFQQMMLPIPPLPTQGKIAAILSAYDDLIENNSRRVKLLEEMAQRIYREWFVDFHYPGYESIPLVSSQLGPIPEGWPPVPASGALIINPKVKVNRAETRPFVPMASLSETGMNIGTIEQRAGTTGPKFEYGDTLFARITPCLENGKTAYVQCLAPGQVGSGSTEFIVFRSRRLCPEYTYLLARSDEFRSHAIKSMSGASGRQRVRDECFESFMLPVPTDALLRTFNAQVAPLFKQSYTLFTINTALRAARDLLLPRLISGELDVTDLTIAMQEAAA